MMFDSFTQLLPRIYLEMTSDSLQDHLGFTSLAPRSHLGSTLLQPRGPGKQSGPNKEVKNHHWDTIEANENVMG